MSYLEVAVLPAGVPEVEEAAEVPLNKIQLLQCVGLVVHYKVFIGRRQ